VRDRLIRAAEDVDDLDALLGRNREDARVAARNHCCVPPRAGADRGPHTSPDQRQMVSEVVIWVVSYGDQGHHTHPAARRQPKPQAGANYPIGDA
jgi:hypothetical protein